MGKIVDLDPRKRQKWKTGHNAPGQLRPHARRRSRQRKGISRIASIAFITAFALFNISHNVPLIHGCDIKGNISHNTGQRIYHLPGQEYYDETRINYFDGERWFCSEEAAREAGWRKAHSEQKPTRGLAFLSDFLDRETVLALLVGIIVGPLAYFAVSKVIGRRPTKTKRT
ncbi:hypothetical protein [Rhizobium sullae]|uniref:Uncharacterized protein n=1 Tax=Rhizobium sullae TaxID=50338 RepID=A0A4R3Q406_RHISU|nr:hypothetical protein [Rhizobium sullae]TCU15781.1 hypothetical protein EV132_106123 [Rhizobium sullae]